MHPLFMCVSNSFDVEMRTSFVRASHDPNFEDEDARASG